MTTTTAHDFTALDEAIAKAEELYPSFGQLRPQRRPGATVAQEGLWIARTHEYATVVLRGRLDELLALVDDGYPADAIEGVQAEALAMTAVLVEVAKLTA
ncbi:hypothetical protein SEA_IAMGROOT_72 [Microbacterium phage IAmGroot]|uniref:Uncharacterized protein n=1 Tax=Microbacterium phage IAmGroot TaxID=2588486 RepID=A0A4Y6E747_9CAUD|nr:hypothetical protein SEA_IAMGROOT_72 [Microbacterium phage IAmGroot]